MPWECRDKVGGARMTPEAITERIQDDPPIRTAESVADSIDADATLLVSGFGSVGYPKAVPLALAADDRDLSLTVVSGGSVGEAIDVALVEAGAIERRYPYQARPQIRAAINEGQIAFQDRNVSGIGDEVQYGRLADGDVAIVEALAVGEGWLVPTTSIGQTPAFVESADALIVEVNTTVPLDLAQFHDIYRPDKPPDRDPIPLTDPADRIGGPRIEFPNEKLLGVVETARRGEPYTFRTPSETDLAIAENLRTFLEPEVRRSPLFENSVRIQFGVGSLGNALMGAVGEADLGDRDLVYFGEVIQDGLLDLLDQGVLESASATSLALSAEGQNRLFENVDRYVGDVVLRPTDVSNSAQLVDRFGVVSVNSALEVDLYGHANSTHVDGSTVLNGVGGSGDFFRHSPLSILALASTADGGDISRVVPMVPHTDHTEHDLDVVITEQGIADLRGTAPRERATKLLETCAHPSFRVALRSYLETASNGGGHIPHDLQNAQSFHSRDDQ